MTWFFTFGASHTHPVTGESLGRAYVEIEGTYAEARQLMIATFGTRWARQCATAQLAGVERWNLRRVELLPLPPAWCGCPVRRAPEIRGDAADTVTAHVDGCTAADDESNPYDASWIARDVWAAAVVEPSMVETVDADVIPHPEPTAAQQLAGDLRALAAMLDASPDLLDGDRYDGLGSALESRNVYVKSRAQVAAYARAAMRAGARVTKHQDDRWAGVDIRFGRLLGLHIYASREEVCERIVVGTEKVTKEVPDPVALAAVPLVTVTETVEQVEWRCMPLLAEPAAIAATPAAGSWAVSA